MGLPEPYLAVGSSPLPAECWHCAEHAVTTQARRLADVEKNAAEAVAVWLGIEMDSFGVDLQFHQRKVGA
jgi:hypothetical protein